jgi:hypothetical protein
MFFRTTTPWQVRGLRRWRKWLQKQAIIWPFASKKRLPDRTCRRLATTCRPFPTDHASEKVIGCP